jgi:hypothetical protein
MPFAPFTLALGLGAALGLGWIAWQAPPRQAAARVNAGLWALLGGLAGGRLVFLGMLWAYGRLAPEQAFALPWGGLSWPGALAGGAALLLLYAAVARQPGGALADGLVPLLYLLAASLWLGCWAAGCAYGAALPGGPGILARDEWGTVALRWPLQPLGAAACLALGWLVERSLHGRSFPGAAANLACLGLCLLMAALSPLRADPAPAWRGLRLDAWAALALAALAGLGFVRNWWSWRKSLQAAGTLQG